MVIVLEFGPGTTPDQGHCAVFLGKTLYSIIIITITLSTPVYSKRNFYKTEYRVLAFRRY